MRRRMTFHSEETMRSVLEAIRLGASSGEAAIEHGVKKSTVDSWVRRGGGVKKLRRKRKPLTGEQA